GGGDRREGRSAKQTASGVEHPTESDEESARELSSTGWHPSGMRESFGSSFPVVSSLRRWYRRCAPQPPANGFEASGFAEARHHHPGGMPAISRGLSAATPPEG